VGGVEDDSAGGGGFGAVHLAHGGLSDSGSRCCGLKSDNG
jgi:hypothetical protein